MLVATLVDLHNWLVDTVLSLLILILGIDIVHDARKKNVKDAAEKTGGLAIGLFVVGLVGVAGALATFETFFVDLALSVLHTA